MDVSSTIYGKVGVCSLGYDAVLPARGSVLFSELIIAKHKDSRSLGSEKIL